MLKPLSLLVLVQQGAAVPGLWRLQIQLTFRFDRWNAGEWQENVT
jgi:hypothetical protein